MHAPYFFDQYPTFDKALAKHWPAKLHCDRMPSGENAKLTKKVAWDGRPRKGSDRAGQSQLVTDDAANQVLPYKVLTAWCQVSELWHLEQLPEVNHKRQSV